MPDTNDDARRYFSIYKFANQHVSGIDHSFRKPEDIVRFVVQSIEVLALL